MSDVVRFPRSPEELTADWLTESLRDDGALAPDHEVTGFEPCLLGEGTGLIGTVARIALTYDDPGAGPPSAVAKFSTTNEQNLELGVTFDLYRREVRFYRDIAPLVEAGCPRCYRSEMRDDGRGCVLLLEDFPDHRAGDQVAGCSPEEAQACMVAAAGLHAVLWDREAPASVMPYSEHGALYHGILPAVWGKLVDSWGELLPSYMAGMGSLYVERIPRLQAWLSSTPPNTVAHGDLRLDNVLFGSEESEDRVVMLDFQGPTWSKGVQDLSYFLTQSVDVEMRRAHERELLADYRAELARHGIDYGEQECWEDYRRSAACNFAVAVTICSAMDATNERATRFMGATIERAATAFDDLDLLAVIDAA